MRLDSRPRKRVDILDCVVPITPLMVAAGLGYLDIVKFLVAHGAGINAREGVTLSTPLQGAVGSGNLDIVQWLVAHGANINLGNRLGTTPLHAAAIAGHNDIVEWLVENGANINARDNLGTTPLNAAAVANHVDMVEWLVEHGADINIVNKSQQAVLDRLYQATDLLRAILTSNIEEAETLLASLRDGAEGFGQQEINEINRALPLAAALNQGAVVHTILSNFRTHIQPTMLRRALVATAANGHLPLLIELYNFRDQLTNTQLIITLEDALYWAGITRHQDIVNFIMHHAFTLEHAPHIDVRRVEQQIAAILRNRPDLGAGERQALNTILKSLSTISDLRQAAGRSGIAENIFELFAEHIHQLPPELIAMILPFVFQQPTSGKLK